MSRAKAKGDRAPLDSPGGGAVAPRPADPVATAQDATTDAGMTVPTDTPCDCGGQVWIETGVEQGAERPWLALPGDVARCAQCGAVGAVADDGEWGLTIVMGSWR